MLGYLTPPLPRDGTNVSPGGPSSARVGDVCVGVYVRANVCARMCVGASVYLTLGASLCLCAHVDAFVDEYEVGCVCGWAIEEVVRQWVQRKKP